MFFHIKKLIKSFSCAFSGIFRAFLSEYNFRIMVFLVFLSAIIVYIFEFEFWKIIILLMAGAVMLIVELVNSAIEKFLDLISKHHNDDIKYIKDVMAGAALVASLLWLLVFLLIIFY